MSSVSESIVPSIITITIGTVAIFLLFGIGSCIRHDSEKYYETVNICLSSGGTWIDGSQGPYSGLCIRNGTTLEK